MMAEKELIGKKVLVTGASSGIGFAITRLFVENGAKVAMLARGKKRLKHAARLINTNLNLTSAFPVICDVTDEDQVKTAFKVATNEMEGLDVVVSNAGSIQWAPIQNTSLDLWNDMLKVHATGYFLISREAIKYFIQEKVKGVIVYIVSDNAVKPSRNMLAYNVAKASELHMARCIADECGQYGIRINSILPGAVFGDSGFWTDDYRKARAEVHGFNARQLEEEYKKNAALSVVIEPEEVAQAALFLASEKTSKITGAAISIDGGGRTGYLR